MGRALDLALGGSQDDVPVGCLVIDADGVTVGSAANRRRAGTDPTAHAEIVALREAGMRLESATLAGCTLVVTLEPCPMCAGAAVLARVGRIVFGAWNPDYGACGSRYDIPRDPWLPPTPEVVGGVLADACGNLVRAFFSARR